MVFRFCVVTFVNARTDLFYGNCSQIHAVKITRRVCQFLLTLLVYVSRVGNALFTHFLFSTVKISATDKHFQNSAT
jgi:hypothetical protein